MRSRPWMGLVFVAAAGVGFLAAGPAFGQSVSLGNSSIEVLDPQADTIFNVLDSSVIIGGVGTDTDLFIYDGVAGDQALWFNVSTGTLYLGGADSGGDLYLRDAGGNTPVQLFGDTGDMYLGAGTIDGDLFLRDTTGQVNFTADGGTATLTLGANGVAGDDGVLILLDNDGVTQNVRFFGSIGEAYLGSTAGDDGDLTLYDGSASGIDLEGSTGSIANKLSGNGIVKAWAQINSDGTVRSCYRCSTLASNTQSLGTGIYEVDFTFDADISSRPVTCSQGHMGVFAAPEGGISCIQRSGDPSSVYVSIRDAAGVSVNSPFTLVVF